MPRFHSATFPVRHYECDAYGHVNNTNYLRYMEEAAFQASADAGYDHHYYQSSGTTWLIRHTEVEFLQPLFYGDSVTVKTWVADMRHIRSIRMYELTRTG
ncbi:MAG: acyl-CoA thioesterase, partial [Anaerolineae bacterium]|nr:acyl-CoA thioesterase [Anaerolineae bacterium]